MPEACVDLVDGWTVCVYIYYRRGISLIFCEEIVFRFKFNNLFFDHIYIAVLELLDVTHLVM